MSGCTKQSLACTATMCAMWITRQVQVGCSTVNTWQIDHRGPCLQPLTQVVTSLHQKLHRQTHPEPPGRQRRRHVHRCMIRFLQVVVPKTQAHQVRRTALDLLGYRLKSGLVPRATSATAQVKDAGPGATPGPWLAPTLQGLLRARGLQPVPGRQCQQWCQGRIQNVDAHKPGR